jgi:hypothetical protein
MNSNPFLKDFATLMICIFIIGLSLSACAHKLYWAKPGAQPGDFDRDVVECKRALAGAQGRGFSPSSLNPAYGIPQSAVDQCMGQKGWYLADKPPDVEPIDPPK